MLRQTPIDAFQQISQLRRRDRHCAICAVARSGRWPDEAPALQPLRKQAHALTIVPQHLDQPAAPAAEHEQMPLCGLRLELVSHRSKLNAALRTRRGPWRAPHSFVGNATDQVSVGDRLRTAKGLAFTSRIGCQPSPITWSSNECNPCTCLRAVRVRLWGTSATCRGARPTSAIGARSDSTRASAFGPLLTQAV
jgi:hypothetical protein